MKSLTLIDGNPLLYRSAMTYADLSVGNTKTGIVYGTPKLIAATVKATNPTNVVVVFDGRGRPNWRKRAFPNYKVSRPKTTTDGGIDLEDLHRQADIVRELLQLAGVPFISVPGVEGDDVLGLLATGARADGWDKVVIASQDKDFYQLLGDPGIVLYDAIRDRWVDASYAEKEVGLAIQNWKLYAAVCGAGGDDIPHPKGIGEKKGVLVAGTLNHPDQLFSEVTKGNYLASGLGWKRQIIESEEMIRLAFRLVSITTVDNISELSVEDKQAMLAGISGMGLGANSFKMAGMLDFYGLRDTPTSLDKIRKVSSLVSFTKLTSILSG